MMTPRRFAVLAALAVALSARPVLAQESAYFVTYDHYLEEPGNLEVSLANTAGVPKGGNAAYSAPWLEIEYGVRGWWTTELYVEGVAARGDSGGFSGWRFENRFRPLQGDRKVNPVLYVEYEDVTEASRIQKEIVGSGPLSFEPISVLRGEHARELETKLILSSAIRGWNVAENVIFEKNMTEAGGIEFGYGVGVSRPLASLASGGSCHFCLENFTAGVEAYGGLGSTLESGLADTRHFVAPVLAWHVNGRSTLKLSTGFGVTEASDRYLFRAAWAYELPVREGRR